MHLLDELLGAPDRDHCPGSAPVVSVLGQEPAAFARELERVQVARVELSRRGAWHGEFAVLDPGCAPRGPEPSPAAFASRWLAARPIVLPGSARALLPSLADELALADELFLELPERGSLRALAQRRLESAGESLEILPRSQPFDDPERDLERVFLASPPPGARGRKVHDLWLKSGWLSTFEEDRSLRVRASFGSEREDDASADLLRHRLVARLADAVLPGAAALARHEPLRGLVESLCGEATLFTQAISYWNAPEGGALFHHDAFHEDGRGTGQLGVCYVQLSGTTFWLALSTQDLGRRVQEFLELLAAGELDWVRARLAPDARSLRALLDLAQDTAALERELGLPGCGRLGALVNHGPEFSALLADAGHAALLEPGDAILLPNHGLECTAMHSVFCAGDEAGYSLSLAIRADHAS
ncbi:MAG: hypothetical protein IPJ19_02890 [Planctomycetes bacterium]|nr:hypothetical protein [Planctomycetota bacterium]